MYMYNMLVGWCDAQGIKVPSLPPYLHANVVLVFMI